MSSEVNIDIYPEKKLIVWLFSAVLVICGSIAAALPASAAVMTDYCLVPPYVKTDVAANIMLMMDNSQDMMDPAYPENTYTPNATKNNYMGYFKPQACYYFDGNKFAEVYKTWAAGSRSSFTSADSCDTAGYNEAGALVAEGVFRGNLMNWATTSKYDLLQKVIIGGNAVSKQGNAHTLLSISGSWTGKTHDGCNFSVTNGSVTISENAEGACDLINAPRASIASLKEVPVKTSSKKIEVLAQKQEESESLLKKTLLTLGEMEFVTSAWAAAGIDIQAGTLNGTVDILYSLTLGCSGTGSECPNGTYTWSFSGLPSWIDTTTYSTQGQKINNKVIISGTPDAPGNYTFTATVGGAASATRSFTINITAAPLSIISPPENTSTDPWLLEEGVFFAQDITAVGGTKPYAWTISAGSLPSGMQICNSASPDWDPATLKCGLYDPGTIYGTPSTSPSSAGDYSFTVTITDASSPVKTDSGTYYMRVDPFTGLSEFFNVKVALIEEPFTDLNGNGIHDPNETFTDENGNGVWDGKQGVFQKYWDDINPKARWGLTQYSTSQGVNIPTAGCIPAAPASSFYTAVQNVQTSGYFPLATGLYGDINYFGFNSTNFPPYVSTSYKGCTGSDPIDNMKCRKNFVLIISSGGDLTGTAFTTNPDGSAFSTAGCSVVNGNQNHALVKNACYGFKNDIRGDKGGKQNVITYTVSTMGSTASAEILEDAAMAGGGRFYEANTSNLEQKLEQAFKDILARAASGTAASVLASGEGSGANLIQAVFYPRKRFVSDEISWIGRLTNLWYYVDPYFGSSSIYEDNASTKKLNLTDDYKITLEYDSTLEQTMADRYNSSDTFVGDTEFENLNSLWEAGLELWERNVTVAATKRKIYATIDGASLLTGNFSADTNDNGSNTSNVDADKAAILLPYLNLGAGEDFNSSGTVDADDARILIKYIHGEDYTGLRNRTVTIKKCATSGDFCSSASDCDIGAGEACNSIGQNTWKLGDILNATPKISSWAHLNLYHINQKDHTYESFLADPIYKNRGMVFAGGNDGMLHAFKLGTLHVKDGLVTGSVKATLCNDTDSDQQCTQTEIDASTDLGKEMWAFIPKNVLPYLKYMTKLDYCHIYSVDLTPYIFDASIGTAYDAEDASCDPNEYWNCSKVKSDSTPLADPKKRWRTVLIGGMRYGGACRNSATTCTDVSGDGVKDCVNTPVADNGYSSYFALDVTDQTKPTLLWEFSSPQLGFSTAGPLAVKINARNFPGGGEASAPASNKNDRWFVVLASGPTGPISATDQQFMGRSDQPLRLFVLDLKTGALLRTMTMDGTNGMPNIPYAFAGSILTSTVDTDYDGQDNVIYIPYVQRAGTSPNFSWTNGGILRLVTKEDLTGDAIGGTALDPDNWAVSTVITNTGPVTSSVVHLQHTRKGELWLYFGSGRYYFEQGGTTDDATGRRQLFGYKEPCYTTSGFNAGCSTSVAFCNDPVNAASTCGGLIKKDCSGLSGTTLTECLDAAATVGWYVNMDGPDTIYDSERVISNPFAIISGTVFFSTYSPYADECAYGGSSYLWAMRYNTGGATGAVQGVVLLQSSTGSIEQINLQEGGILGEKQGRRTAAIEGKPPEGDPPPLLTSPPAVKRVIHMRER